jgi:hypothetical protein
VRLASARYGARSLATWWRGLGRGDRVRIGAACFVAALLTVGYEVQKAREPERQAPALPTTGPAARLTAIQLGYRPGPRSTMLRRIDSLLELLEAQCPANTRRQLETLTLRSIRQLRAVGVAAAPNGVLGGVVGAQTIGSTQDCAMFFRRYVTKSKSGQT